MAGRPWTVTELERVRIGYRCGAGTVAAELRRSIKAVHQAAFKLGITGKKAPRSPEMDSLIRNLHAQGWSDSEIAAEYNRRHPETMPITRHRVGEIRAEFGLGSNRLADRQRDRVRQKTREQLRLAGAASLAEIRAKVFHDVAERNGWPRDLRPRAVQILNALWVHGPMTRRQIARAVGMPWKGSRKSLVSNDPGGSYLAYLIRRGLVVSLGKLAKGKGKGRSAQIYALPLGIERRIPGRSA